MNICLPEHHLISLRSHILYVCYLTDLTVCFPQRLQNRSIKKVNELRCSGAPSACYLEPHNTAALSMQMVCRMSVNYPCLRQGATHCLPNPSRRWPHWFKAASQHIGLVLANSQSGLKYYYIKLLHATNLYLCLRVCVFVCFFLYRISPASTT